MLFNISHNDKEITAQINELVGKSFGLKRRFSKGGIGSPKLWVLNANEEIINLLDRDSYINTGNIELRPRGIIFRFRSKLDTYALVLPYHQLTLFKGKARELSLYANEWKVVLKCDQTAEKRFFDKLIDIRIEYLSSVAMP